MSCAVIKAHDEAPYKCFIDRLELISVRGRSAAQKQHMLSESVQLLHKHNVPENTV